MTALAVARPTLGAWRSELWVPVGAVVVALLGGLALVAAAGVSLPAAVAAFADGAWGSAYAVGASLNRAVALGFVGLGFIVAHRANLTNVGGEGQIAMGGIVSTALCLYGGAAHMGSPGDEIIIMAYGYLNEAEVAKFKSPKVVRLGEKNKLK